MLIRQAEAVPFFFGAPESGGLSLDGAAAALPVLVVEGKALPPPPASFFLRQPFADLAILQSCRNTRLLRLVPLAWANALSSR